MVFVEGIKSTVVKLLLNLNMESDINRENCEGSKICRIPRFDFSVNDDKPFSVSLNSPGSAVCKEKKIS